MSLAHWFLFYRGRILERLRLRDAAEQAYRAALHAHPAFGRAAETLAHLCARAGRYTEAERWLEQASRLDPSRAQTFHNLGFVRDRLGQPEAAIEAFARAVRLDPGLHQAWYGMGLCHAQLGRHKDAAAALEECATRQPENRYAWFQLGMAYHCLRETGKVEEVIRHLYRFDPRSCRKLIMETGRSDLAHLVRDIPE